jgi:hypothetical protein
MAEPPPAAASSHRLIILYGIGGLSDVGRHAALVAHDLIVHQASADASLPKVGEVLVMTKFPDLLFQSNWNCGCPDPHQLDLTKFSGGSGTAGGTNDPPSADSRLRIVKVADWKDPALLEHFAPANGASASATTVAPETATTSVISCLGNRQAVGNNDASEATEHLILPAMQRHQIRRLVSITSVGIEEDWPAMEFFPLGKAILSCLFLTFMRRAFRDLTRMERLVRGAAAAGADQATGIDYLLVRPVGIGEDVAPRGRWQIQKQKYVDKLGIEMAKLDVARFMVLQSLQPTLHRTAVVIGGVLDESAAQVWNERLTEKSS